MNIPATYLKKFLEEVTFSFMMCLENMLILRSVHMFKKISFVMLLSLIFSLPVKSQSTVADYKKSINSASWEQVFDRGLKGVGKCRIIPAILNSVQTWRVKTTKVRSGILGDGVVDITLLGTLKIAHGFAWDPALNSLAFPNVLFPSSYAPYKGANSEQNAALMLKKAVSIDLCDISTSDLPTTKSVNMSAATDQQMKNNFRFYLDPARNLRCTSTLHSKPVWNPTTCRWVSKSVVISQSACKRAFQKASVGGRAAVGSQTANVPRNLPTVDAWTAEIERDVLQADLPIKTQILAEFASTNIELPALGDISIIPAVNPSNATDVANAAKAKLMLDVVPANVVMPDWLQSAKQTIASRSQVLNYIANPSNVITDYALKPISEIDVIKSGYLQPIRDIFPDMSAVVSGCGPRIDVEFRRVDVLENAAF
jgi:hypothetical protein